MMDGAVLCSADVRHAFFSGFPILDRMSGTDVTAPRTEDAFIHHALKYNVYKAPYLFLPRNEIGAFTG